MLICMNCNVEYEEGRKFCKYCGEPLVPKIEPISPVKKEGGIIEGRSGGKLICPDCQIIYEFGNSCIQCGSVLTPTLPSSDQEKLKSNHPKIDQEREVSRHQTSQELKIKKPLEHLICPDCQIVYEQGDFCIQCGATLILQEPSQTKEELKKDPEPDDKKKPILSPILRESAREVPRKKFICPTCKIIYEHEGTCIRCGLTLVAQSSFKEEENSYLPAPAPAEPEQFAPPGPIEKSSGTHETSKVKEVEPPPIPEPEGNKETLPPEPSAQPSVSQLAEDLERRLSFSKKRKIDYRRLFIEVGSLIIMAVAGGYICWSIFSHMNKEIGTQAIRSKETTSTVLLSTSKTANVETTPSTSKENAKEKNEPTPLISGEKVGFIHPSPHDSNLTDRIFSEKGEIEKIRGLLENIRQANLKKDIDLFLSCYSTDFKDREGKKKATLDNWKKFDYLDLSYDLKNPLISGDIAKAKVEWLIKIFPTTGGKPQESKTLLDIILKKEGENWKINEVKLSS